MAESSRKFIDSHTIYGVGDEHGTPYMTRAWIGRLRLHIFHRGDNDPDCHDHPWPFWTFPLHSYVEQVVAPDIAMIGRIEPYGGVASNTGSRLHLNVVKAWRLHFRPAEHTHRVLGRYSGTYTTDATGEPIPNFDGRKVVTLVWTGRQTRRWGFLKYRDGRWCWVHWKEYRYRGGKHAPCGPREEADHG